MSFFIQKKYLGTFLLGILLTCVFCFCGGSLKAEAATTFQNNPDSYNVLSNIASLAGSSGYNVLQGGCTTRFEVDGKMKNYAYFIVQNQSQSQYTNRIVRVDMSTWTVDKVSGSDVESALNHGNDITYSGDLDALVVANGAGASNKITYVDKNSLELKEINGMKYRELKDDGKPLNIYSIEYNEARAQYVVGLSYTEAAPYTFAILNKDFEVVKKPSKFDPNEPFNINPELYHSNINTQGIDCDNDYIYFIQSDKNQTNSSSNYVAIYDWDTGEYVNGLTVSVASNTYQHFEGENIFHLGNNFYIGYYCRNKTDNTPSQTVYRTMIKPTKYKVTYNPNSGSGNMSDTNVTFGVLTPLRANVFTKSGFEFEGWIAKRDSDDKSYYINSTGSTGWYTPGEQPNGYAPNIYEDGASVSKSSSVDNDTVTMYAQWEINYTIIYDANDGWGTDMKSTTVTYGEPTPLRANEYKKTGYLFKGWYGYRISDSKWLYENTSGNQAWYLEGSQPSGYKKAYYNDKDLVSKTSTVNGDFIRLYAQWTPIKYQINYIASDASGTMAPTTVNYGEPTPLRTNTYSKTGYLFKGWYGYRTSDQKWLYENASGDQAWYPEGSQPSGYKKAFYYNGDSVAKTSTVDGDVIYLIAQWTPITYLIKYNANTGLGSTMSSTTVTYGESTPLRTNEYYRTDASFKGWYARRASDNKWLYVDSDGEQTWYLEGSQPSGYKKYLYKDKALVAKTTNVNNDVVTMYAQWS